MISPSSLRAVTTNSLWQVSRSIAKEAYKYGITCNAICPSADTRMTLTPEVKANRERKLKAGLMTQEQYDRQNLPRGLQDELVV